MKNAYAIISLAFFLLPAQHSFAQDYKDCETAFVPCGESPFHIEVTNGEGVPDPGIDTTCLEAEFSSTWIAWTVSQAGAITFVITPDDESHDIDFLVYQFNDGNDCQDKTLIRCMASGENPGQDPSQWEICIGPTGLAFGETDVVEYPGCSPSDNNFLAPIEAEEGDSYVMLVNYFTTPATGITVSFGGTAELECISIPVAATEPQAEDLSLFEIRPTLSSGAVSVQLSSERFLGAQLSIYDLLGRPVYAAGPVQQLTQPLDLTGLPGGIYLAVMEKDGQVAVRRFWVGR